MRRKIFLVSGFSRGGTNVLWNLICSHPGVISTGLELNEILGPSRTDISMQWKVLVELFAVPGIPYPQFVKSYVRQRVLDFAEQNARESWGQWKQSGLKYTEDEIKTLPVCTKSVNSWARDWLFGKLKRNISLKYTQALRGHCESLPTVYLIRDAEAQCNGWMRRGCIPREAGKWYRYIVEKMLEDYKSRPDEIMFVKFEDVLNKPLMISGIAHRFLGLDGISFEEYHLKSKKVLGSDGLHQTRRGVEGEMIWMSNSDVESFLDPGVDSRQRNCLSSADRKELLMGLGDICERLHHVLNNKFSLNQRDSL